MVKVLYIEDNDDDVYMLKMRLELLGNFEVLTAADGEKGCEVAAAERPDIILMDLETPVVDGWEAARRLKSNSQTQDIPIIALSAHALAGERHVTVRSRFPFAISQCVRIRKSAPRTCWETNGAGSGLQPHSGRALRRTIGRAECRSESEH